MVEFVVGIRLHGRVHKPKETLGHPGRFSWRVEGGLGGWRGEVEVEEGVDEKAERRIERSLGLRKRVVTKDRGDVRECSIKSTDMLLGEIGNVEEKLEGFRESHLRHWGCCGCRGLPLGEPFGVPC